MKLGFSLQNEIPFIQVFKTQSTLPMQLFEELPVENIAVGTNIAVFSTGGSP